MKVKLTAPLHEYQKKAVRHVLRKKGNALFLEMGLGKTLSTLEILSCLRQLGEAKRTLIVAPKRICDQVWRQEAQKWGFSPIGYLGGSPSSRQMMLKNPTHDAYLITYELLPWLEEQDDFPFDCMVFDEISKLKNSKSKRWRALKQIIRRHPDLIRIGLTGTPAPNGYADLWAQLYILDDGATLGEHKTKYLHTYFRDVSRDPQRYNRWVLRPGAQEVIEGMLRKGGVLTMRASDVLKQTKPIVLPHLEVRLGTTAQTMYEELETELLARLPDGRVILPYDEGVVNAKLRQVSSGFIVDEQGTPQTICTAKVKALADYLEEMNGEPLLLVYTYRHELAMIRQHLGYPVPYIGGGVSTADAGQAVVAWNRRELPLLAVQPQSAGHGLNLQEGGHNILFYSTDWNLETYQQVVARLDRQGQKSQVFVRHMIAGDVEGAILEQLRQKAGLQNQLMEKV
jgi:SNF2 family DNA or RNA helicase